MSPCVVFRFDASRLIGAGHGFRCLVLARQMVRSGWRVAVAASAATFETIRLPDGMRRIRLDDNLEDEAMGIGAKVGAADLMVVDHYGRDARFETRCRDWAGHVLVIDDLADRPHDCEILLDQTLGRQESDYRPWVPEGCRLILGPDFALLREDFAAQRPDALARRERPELKRILVSMGGTDPNDMATTVVQGLLDSGLEVEVDVVLGSASGSAALKLATEACKERVRLLPHVKNMAELMRTADLAIGAGGVTSWERCCMGLPALVIVTAGNQELIATRLADAGAVRVLGRLAEVGREDVAAAVSDLGDTPSALARMAAAASEICDGRGAERVLAAVAEVV